MTVEVHRWASIQPVFHAQFWRLLKVPKVCDKKQSVINEGYRSYLQVSRPDAAKLFPEGFEFSRGERFKSCDFPVA